MMAFQNPVGQQPDIQRVVQSARTFANSFTEELAKLPNVPAIAQGNAIQDTLTQILAQMNRTEAQMNRIETKLDALTTRISTK
jgi:hypothetical protein